MANSIAVEFSASLSCGLSSTQLLVGYGFLRFGMLTISLLRQPRCKLKQGSLTLWGSQLVMKTVAQLRENLTRVVVVGAAEGKAVVEQYAAVGDV